MAGTRALNQNQKIILGVKSSFTQYAGWKIYVGFSGGADSCALLLALQSVAPELNITLKAVHFEHGIRGAESLCDADWCTKFCLERQIEFQKISLNTPENRLPGENLEAAARRLRLHHWAKLATTPDCAVALGHHADDVMENVMLRLFRGGNTSSLSALRPKRIVNDVIFLRPLLDFSRRQLRDFLRENQLDSWCEDKTNEDTSNARNYLRREVLPQLNAKFPFALPGIHAAAEALQCDADYLEHAANEAFKSIQVKKTTSVEFWQNLHPALCQRVLKLWLSFRLNRFFVPDSHLMRRFNDTLNADHSEPKEIPVAGGGKILIQHNSVSISKKITPPEETCWNWQDTASVSYGFATIHSEMVDNLPAKISVNEAYMDAELLPAKLLVRNRRDGDRIVPFGRESEVKLKKFFTDAGVSSKESRIHPLLCLPDNTIIWVPGVRQTNFAPVSLSTKIILKFSLVTLDSIDI